MVVLILIALSTSFITFAQSDEIRAALDECLKTNNITPLEYLKSSTTTDKELITSCLNRRGFKTASRVPGQSPWDVKEAERALAP